MPIRIWNHDDCGCRREPIVGARYRRKKINVLTGENLGWRTYTLVAVEPSRVDRLRCRMATLQGDDGGIIQPFVQDLFERYQAIENVMPIRRPFRTDA